ncbi:MAG: hypothetical protein JRH11_19785, partial [Deltaproteobacteria bacterium]|nr:hypothetical protein [Deltaproteobacteria bacterium]
DELLRSDVVAYGLGSERFPLFLEHLLSNQRAGEILIEVGEGLRQIEEAPDGNYGPQVAAVAAEVSETAAQIIAAGGRVQLMVSCSTPLWLATHPYEHNALSGERGPSAEPIYGCSVPSDLAAWRSIMRAVADHFAPYADSMTIVIGSEPDSYFVGERDDLHAWYEHSVRGVLESDAGPRYRVGGLTPVTAEVSHLGHAIPTLGSDDVVTFASREYDEPLTQSWIRHAGAAGLPIDVVTLHMFGDSPAPKETTRWNQARRKISGWLADAGYDPATVDVVIDDWAQWAPYTTNDTEYMAAYTASGRIAMLDYSLRNAGTVRMLQAFLMPWGFRPPGDAPGGFNGVPALSTELGIIKPVFNVHSMLATMNGSIEPVLSSDPFVSGVAADEGPIVSILVSNHVPVERQVDELYDFWEQRPIIANDFGGNDITLADVDLSEFARVFYDGEMPSWQQLFDDAFADPSRIDVSVLSWSDEAKEFFRGAQRVGRLGRIRRAAPTRVDLGLSALPAGTYQVEEFVVDGSHANTYGDRAALGARVLSAQSEGAARLVEVVQAITTEYGLESGRVRDSMSELGGPAPALRLVMEPNSVHLVRLTRSGG